jgi:hypothetical protein
MAKLQLETINPMVLQQLDPELVSYTFHTVHNWFVLRIEQRCVVHAPQGTLVLTRGGRFVRSQLSRQIHGLEIIDRENRFFQACLKNAVSEGQPQGYQVRVDMVLTYQTPYNLTQACWPSVLIVDSSCAYGCFRVLPAGLHQQGGGARLQQPGRHLRPAQQVAAEVRTAPSQLTSEVHV